MGLEPATEINWIELKMIESANDQIEIIL